MFPFSDFFWFDDSAYRFNRPMLERQGWYSKEKDGRLLVLLNVLGINEDDLNIEVTPADNGREAISISGTTKDEVFDKEYDQMEIAYYDSIIARNPAKKIYAKGWRNRALAV